MFLIGILLVVSPAALGELTVAEYEQITRIVTTANEQQTGALKDYVDVKVAAVETATAAEIRAMNGQFTELTGWMKTLVVVVISVSCVCVTVLGVVVTVLGMVLKKAWDEQRVTRQELQTQREENVELRAEIESLRPKVITEQR